MSLRQDFDRIALVSTDGATHNDHYHNFLLRHLPPHLHNALEIGCGTGAFARRLAERSQHVMALDLSSEMIRLARTQSAQLSNIEFQLSDIRDQALAAESFDCIASIATLHHLPYGDMLLKMKAALKPGGVLLVLDLFEPAGLSQPGGFLDSLTNVLAVPVSVSLRLIHHGRLLRPREEREAWSAHERHDSYLTMREVRTLCAEVLPGASVKKHLLCAIQSSGRRVEFLGACVCGEELRNPQITQITQTLRRLTQWSNIHKLNCSDLHLRNRRNLWILVFRLSPVTCHLIFFGPVFWPSRAIFYALTI
jgi:ubiquinone/menaquinone biosynthesis C-methylase UbiE